MIVGVTLVQAVSSRKHVIVPTRVQGRVGLSSKSTLRLRGIKVRLLLHGYPARLGKGRRVTSCLSILCDIVRYNVTVYDRTRVLMSTNVCLPRNAPIARRLTRLITSNRRLVSTRGYPICPMSGAHRPIYTFFPVLERSERPLTLLLYSEAKRRLSRVRLKYTGLITTMVTGGVGWKGRHRVGRRCGCGLARRPGREVYPRQGPIPTPPSKEANISL